MEVTPENFEKLQKKASSLESAIHSEREWKRELKAQLEEIQSKLSEYEKQEKEKQEQEALKRWEYEKLLEKEKAEKEEALKKAQAYDEYLEKSKQETEKKLATLEKDLSPDVVESFGDIYKDLPDEKKVLFLEKIKEKTELKTFWIPPKKASVWWEFTPLSISDFEALSQDAKKKYMQKSISVNWQVDFSD